MNKVSDGRYKYIISDGKAYLAGFETEPEGDVVFPSEFENIPVTKIASGFLLDGPFSNCGKIKSVTVPDSVESIGNWAFYGCNQLETVNIPSSVKFIGAKAFYGCLNLKEVWYDGYEKDWNKISIGFGNGSLTCASVHKNDEINEYNKEESSDKENEDNLTSEILPKDEHNEEKNQTFPNEEEKPEYDEINYRETDDMIISAEQEKLDETEKDYQAENIAEQNTEKSNITPEETEKSEEPETEITPEIIEKTYDGAYENEPEKENADEIADIENAENSGGIIDIPENNPDEKIIELEINVDKDENENKVSSPKDNTEINEKQNKPSEIGADNNSDIPKEKAIYETDNLTFVYSFVSPEQISINDVKEARGDVVLPAEINNIPVCRIGNTAFASMKEVTSVLLPESIEVIGFNAFKACSNLLSINLPEKLNKIYNFAFVNCSSLKKIEIPKLITYLPKSIFAYCSQLKEISFPNKLSYIGEFAFRGCSSLESVSIPDTVEYLGPEAFIDCINLKEVKMPARIEKIDIYTFSNCVSLTSVKIPKKVSKIKDFAFNNCTSLEEIYLPASLEKVGLKAFSRCPSIKNVYYEGSKEEFEKISFESVRNLLSSAEIHYGEKY